MAKNEKDVRGHIMRVSATLFAQKGYTGTSIREIVSHSQINLSMISYYFGGKEGLFKAIVEECYKPVLAFFDTHKGTPPLECLHAFICFAFDYAQNS